MESNLILKTDMVTDGFGYIGRFIVHELLGKNSEVTILSDHFPLNDPLNDKIQKHHLSFDDSLTLTKTLKKCRILYNTFGIRCNSCDNSFKAVVEQSKRLIDCAVNAQVEKFIQISFSEEVDSYLKKSNLPYCLISYSILFGQDNTLLNNIAWMVNYFPLVGYHEINDRLINPAHVQDLAEIAVNCAVPSENQEICLCGNESYSVRAFLELIAKARRKKRYFIEIPEFGLRGLVGLLRFVLKDVIITDNEFQNLYFNRDSETIYKEGKKSFKEWLKKNNRRLGYRYSREFHKNYANVEKLPETLNQDFYQNIMNAWKSPRFKNC